MLSEQQIQQFHEEGYLLGPRVLDDEQVAVLQNETLRVIEQHDRKDLAQPATVRNLSGNEAAPVWQIVNICWGSKPFADLVSSAAITTAVAQLTDAHQLRLWHDQIQYKPSSVGGVNGWHQDSPAWPVLTPQTEQVTAWVALDDVDEDNGCMSMVPGSHQWGDRSGLLHTFKDYDDLPATCDGHAVKRVLRPVKKGHVHFHHSLTWHGSHANRSGRPRRAIALHYMTDQTRYRAAGYHLMKPYIKVADGEPLIGDAFPLVYGG